jgi:predicted RNA binding protein with dsRBD fold (UPF0201 family)
MEIVLKHGEKVHTLKVKPPEKLKKLHNAVGSVFKKARGVKAPKKEDMLINVLSTISEKLDGLSKKLEERHEKHSAQPESHQ